MIARRKHFLLFAALLVVAGRQSVSAVSPAPTSSARPSKPAYLVAMPNEPSWREFAFLAAVPAASAARPTTPVVIALDRSGTITPEVNDFLSRYKPDAVYRIGDAEPAIQPDFARGCVLHLPMDNSPEAIVGANPQVIGTIDWQAEGRKKGAARLGGAGSLDCGRPASGFSGEGMTVSAWVKPTPKGAESFISCGDGATHGWVLGMNAFGRPEFSVVLAERGIENCGHLVKIEPDRWAHLAGVLTADGTVKLYLNGRCVMMLATGSPLQRGGSSLLIGAGGGRTNMHGQLDEVRLYDRPLTDVEIALLAENPLPGAAAPPAGMRTLAANSAAEAAVALADVAWTQSDRAVLCRDDDYEHALVASTLAARLGAPLLYLDAKGKLSTEARAAIERLRVREAITVGDRESPKLQGIAPRTTHLADARELLKWMVAQQLPVNYFAAANPADRQLGMVRKASLAAPVLAVARQGFVTPIPYETSRLELWVKTGAAVHERPAGAVQGKNPYGGAAVWGYTATAPKLAAGLPSVYPVKGSFRGWPYSPMMLAASTPDADGYDRMLVDSNRDGTYGPGEVLAPGDTFSVQAPRAHTDLAGTLMRFVGSHGGPKDFVLDVELLNWYRGTFHAGGHEHQFVATSRNGFSYDLVQFDLNRNGSFDDPGEGPFSTGEEMQFDGKRWTVKITLNRHAGLNTGDVTLTYPSTTTVHGELARYRAILGRHPAYVCIVGLYDAIPFGHSPGSEAVSDLPYSQADEDPFMEMSVGRVIGESATDVTLLAARSVSYADLLDPAWSTRVASVGDWVTATRQTTILLENAGFDAPVEPAEQYADTDLLNRAVVTHAQHAAPLGLGYGPNNLYEGLLAPCLVESFIGCASSGLDLPLATKSPRWVNGRPGQWVAARMLQKGAVAYLGNTRPASAFNSTAHAEFWNTLLEGATVGQALQTGLNTTIYYGELEKPVMTFGHAARMIQLYGDPALKIHVPHSPTVRPPQIRVDGKRLVVTGPSAWWVNGPLHHAPGIHPEFADPGHFHVNWHTRNQVTEIQQISELPSPLGWNRKLLVDEHQDGSRTLHWRVKLIDFDPTTGAVRNRAERVEFALGVEK